MLVKMTPGDDGFEGAKHDKSGSRYTFYCDI